MEMRPGDMAETHTISPPWTGKESHPLLLALTILEYTSLAGPESRQTWELESEKMRFPRIPDAKPQEAGWQRRARQGRQQRAVRDEVRTVIARVLDLRFWQGLKLNESSEFLDLKGWINCRGRVGTKEVSLG